MKFQLQTDISGVGGAIAAESDARMAARAIVHADGTIDELDDPRGAWMLLERGSLVTFVAGFLRAGLPKADFVWVDPGHPWMLVHLFCVAHGPDGARAVITELRLADPTPFGLTPRELDVLTLLAGGLSNPEIGDRLFTSRRTVSTHVERVLAKLRLQSRAGAAAVALEQGLMRLPLPGGARGFEHLAVGGLQKAVEEKAARVVAKPPIFSAPRPRRLIGVLVSGDEEPGGDREEALHGCDLAIAEINSAGGIGGAALERFAVDVDIDDLESVSRGLGDLVAAGVDAIAFGYTYAFAEHVLDQVAEYGCPVLSAMASEEQGQWVRDRPETLGRVFQVGPPETNYLAGLIRWLHWLDGSGGWQPPNRRVLCVQTPVAAGQIVSEEARAVAAELGWKLDTTITVANRDADWTPVLETMHEIRPAAIGIMHFVPTELAHFQQEFADDPIGAIVHCVYAPSIPAYLDHAGPAAEGVVWSATIASYGDSIGVEFARRFEALHGRLPGRSLAGVAYDQVNLLADAWSRVGNPRAFEEVAGVLRSRVHRGVCGVYAFGNPQQSGVAYPDQTRDPSVGHAHLFFQVQDGVNRAIGPQPYAESRFILPPWISR